MRRLDISPQLSCPVPQWSHYGHQTLHGDAHQEVTLARHHDVLQGVEQVGKHHDVELCGDVHSMVADEEDEEGDLEDGESDETLVECRFHVGVAEDHDGGQVAQQPHTADQRDGDPLQEVVGPDLQLGECRAGTVSRVQLSFHQRGRQTELLIETTRSRLSLYFREKEFLFNTSGL